VTGAYQARWYEYLEQLDALQPYLTDDEFTELEHHRREINDIIDTAAARRYGGYWKFIRRVKEGFSHLKAEDASVLQIHRYYQQKHAESRRRFSSHGHQYAKKQFLESYKKALRDAGPTDEAPIFSDDTTAVHNPDDETDDADPTTDEGGESQ